MMMVVDCVVSASFVQHIFALLKLQLDVTSSSFYSHIFKEMFGHLRFKELKVCKSSNSDLMKRSVNLKSDLWSPQFSQKTNETIRLYYYDTSGRIVFVRFFGRIEDTKKSF